MAEIARKTKRCPADLTDEEWRRVQPLLPKVSKRGRKPATDLREGLNAICTMHGTQRRWLADAAEGLPAIATRSLGETAAELTGPTCVLVVPAPCAPAARSATWCRCWTGNDQGEEPARPVARKVLGRKRHIAVDTDGRLLMANLRQRRHLGQCWGSDEPGCRPQPLAMAETSVSRWRRLVRDYEARLDVSEAFIHVAMGSLLLRRISH